LASDAFPARRLYELADLVPDGLHQARRTIHDLTTRQQPFEVGSPKHLRSFGEQILWKGNGEYVEPRHGNRVHFAAAGEEHELIGFDPVVPEEDPLHRISRNAERPHSPGRLTPLMQRSTEGDLGYECRRGSGLNQLRCEQTAIELKRLDFPALQRARTRFEVVEPD
jgi:hypothetical protein